MKLIAVAFFTLMLMACAPSRPVLRSYLERADIAIARQEWEIAYRFLEDGFIVSQPELRARAIGTVREHPEVVTAGFITFSRDSLSKTLSDHGEDRGVDLERKRLAMFRAVATSNAYEIAKANVDSVAINTDNKRKEQQRLSDEMNIKDELARSERIRKEEESRTREEENRAQRERRRHETKLALIVAAQKSRFACQSRPECDKAFALTQIFVSEYSDMKIQVSTETIIETFNPTDSMKTGLKAMKIPLRADTAEIVVTASCRDEGRESFVNFCDEKLLSIYRAYPAFVKTALRP